MRKMERVSRSGVIFCSMLIGIATDLSWLSVLFVTSSLIWSDVSVRTTVRVSKARSR